MEKIHYLNRRLSIWEKRFWNIWFCFKTSEISLLNLYSLGIDEITLFYFLKKYFIKMVNYQLTNSMKTNIEKFPTELKEKVLNWLEWDKVIWLVVFYFQFLMSFIFKNRMFKLGMRLLNWSNQMKLNVYRNYYLNDNVLVRPVYVVLWNQVSMVWIN